MQHAAVSPIRVRFGQGPSCDWHRNSPVAWLWIARHPAYVPTEARPSSGSSSIDRRILRRETQYRAVSAAFSKEHGRGSDSRAILKPSCRERFKISHQSGQRPRAGRPGGEVWHGCVSSSAIILCRRTSLHIFDQQLPDRSICHQNGGWNHVTRLWAAST